MIPRIGSALRRTARIVVERPRATLWTLVALTCALFAVGVAALAADNVDRWTTAPRGDASMVVYLGEGVDAAHAGALADELGKLPGVERAELVPAAESAKRLQQALGADSALLDGVDVASLPASVEVTLAPGVRDVIAMSPTVRALRGMPGVDDVVVENGGTDRVAGTLAAVRVIGWAGAALLSALALVVVLAAVRVRLDRSKQELAVLDLLGASAAFTIVPTALAGAVQGAVAAALAAVALWIGIALYGDAFAHALGSIDLPAADQLALFVGLGAALGLVGGGLAGSGAGWASPGPRESSSRVAR